jgi:hypothetical protein
VARGFIPVGLRSGPFHSKYTLYGGARPFTLRLLHSRTGINPLATESPRHNNSLAKREPCQLQDFCLLLRHRHRERHDIADRAAGFADFRRTETFHFIDAHDRVHRHKTAHHTLELSLELFFARIDDHLRALAKDEFFHFQEAPQITLIDLLGIHFVHLALVKKNHLVDWSFTFGHGGRATHRGIKMRARTIA